MMHDLDAVLDGEAIKREEHASQRIVADQGLVLGRESEEILPFGIRDNYVARHRYSVCHKKIEEKVLAAEDASIDTATANGRLVVGIFAALAEFERARIVERVDAGLEAARGCGRNDGRPFKMTPETGLTSTTLYSADICERFYDADRDAITRTPVFVAYTPLDWMVQLNDEHSDFRWLPLDEAEALMPFAGQRATLKHIKKEFADRQPNPLRRIQAQR